VIDMDHDDSTALLTLLRASNTLKRSGLPVLGLTRRGDLKTKLRAFDLGVDDILNCQQPYKPRPLRLAAPAYHPDIAAAPSPNPRPSARARAATCPPTLPRRTPEAALVQARTAVGTAHHGTRDVIRRRASPALELLGHRVVTTA
jgi:DNA-binding response OmpR family regulator